MAARGRRKKVVNGIVLVNKAAGLTSRDVVQKVTRIYSAKKAGHTGTLDPFATGLLPVCLGEATKVSGLLLASDKRYIASLGLGIETDTGDHDGEIIEQMAVPLLTQDKIEAVLETFRGEILQVPPMYSSLKFEGQSLHVYARKGIEIEREPRQVQIMELSLLDFDQHQIRFEVHCSKGTYVRVLGEDIAKALGTVGHLTALHRTQTGVFKADMMRDLDEIAMFRVTNLLPIDIALIDYEAIYLTLEQKNHLWMGGFLFDVKPQNPQEDCLVRLYNEHQQIFAIGEWRADKQRLKIKRGFNVDPSLDSHAQ
ncbi:MAG: tRNA pseudouridine(55) synthase TruB [Thiomicrospira sp.]|uniref:tRNA pseudouridine(55) synthase TruB n=1 Tax=Thiomicrospira sp. TaxID=935 RepID=UPI0019EC47B2|nr:tRNA pseudouridine(55) synthase TruB [Thiomicrospira sp.]MBE0493282.1 tRNA pseudouridine(55) synthase TruB [Thiomicrospira sp.]